MAIGSNAKNMNFNLHFYDDESFIHRKKETFEKFLVEKVDDRITRAWALLFKLRFRFDGVKGISAGMYTVTHNNDTVYDPFNQVGDSFKQGTREILKKGGGPVQALIVRTKENTFKRHSKNKRKNPVYDKAFWLLGGLITVLGLAIFIAAVT